LVLEIRRNHHRALVHQERQVLRDPGERLLISAPEVPLGEGFRSLGEPVSVTFESERIQLVNLMREPAGDEYELTGAGPYRVRVWAGPQEEDAEEELESCRFFERFVMQLRRRVGRRPSGHPTLLRYLAFTQKASPSRMRSSLYQEGSVEPAFWLSSLSSARAE